MYLPEITSTHLTITEQKKIIDSLITLKNKQVFFKMIETLELDLKEVLKDIKGTENIKI